MKEIPFSALIILDATTDQAIVSLYQPGSYRTSEAGMPSDNHGHLNLELVVESSNVTLEAGHHNWKQARTTTDNNCRPKHRVSILSGTPAIACHCHFEKQRL